MRSTISLLILVVSFCSFAQRLKFDDPTLHFSFKKPTNWQLFDDGYVVKVSPEASDTLTTYFSITYFENATPDGYMESDLPQVIPFEEHTNQTVSPDDIQETKIAKTSANWRTSEVEMGAEKLQLNQYTFNRFGQRWEIVTASPLDEKGSNDRLFKKMIRSLKIEKRSN